MKICLMLALIDLAGVSSSERLHLRTLLGASCLEIAGSEGIRLAHPFYRLVSEGALQIFVVCSIMGQLRSMVKSAAENAVEDEI
jgi:hypothetical protein